jgi:photosystem II stability/assembly factor-like uncharacterized protein
VAAGESETPCVFENCLASDPKALGELGDLYPGEVVDPQVLDICRAKPTLMLLRRANLSPPAANLGIRKVIFSQVNRLARGVGVTSAHLHWPLLADFSHHACSGGEIVFPIAHCLLNGLERFRARAARAVSGGSTGCPAALRTAPCDGIGGARVLVVPRRIALRVALVLVAVAMAGCASSPSANHRTTTTTALATTTTTSTVRLTPVPAGFTPDSFTAVSDQQYWVLGTAPCESASCWNIVSTSDGGQHFAAIPSPPLAALSPNIGYSLAFATNEDGYLYNGTTFLTTHDGGGNWQTSALGGIQAFATSGGYVYVLSAQHCTSGSCRVALFRSPVGEDHWTTLSMPIQVIPASQNGTPYAPGVELAAHGPSLWVVGPNGASVTAPDILAISTDDGSTFTTVPALCSGGLRWDLQPKSRSVVWALCVTGLHSSIYRSVDGGLTFTPLSSAPESANSATLAPQSDTSAFFFTAGFGSPEMQQTTDGGASWTASSFQPQNFVGWMGFTDPTTGEALVQNPTTNGTIMLVLWRTTDGGGSWSKVNF